MLPVFNSSQLKAWDQFTILNEPIKSIDLMERASDCFVKWMAATFDQTKPVLIFCGNGNNGGDGLAIARKLVHLKYTVNVFCCHISLNDSTDFQINLERLMQSGFDNFLTIQSLDQFLSNNKPGILIDALLGYGVNRPVSDNLIHVLSLYNGVNAIKISIDIPSGLFIDQMSSSPCIWADYTFTFQCPKLSQLIADTGIYCGTLIIGDIGLDQDFLLSHFTDCNYIVLEDVKNIYKKRNPFAFKNQFGHCLVIGGSFEMCGATILSAEAAMRAGAGLVSVSTLEENRNLVIARLPEVQYVKPLGITFSKYQSVLIGPGMGHSKESQMLVEKILKMQISNLVIDADGLNIIAQNNLHELIPVNSILTPHIGEFDRLFGKSENGFERLIKARTMAVKYSVYIILKGKYTAICTPENEVYFNSTGNAGLAKAGSGDVLSGILCSFLSQSYSYKNACLLGVYLHGLSADLCVDKMAQEVMTATDVISNLSPAFKFLNE